MCQGMVGCRVDGRMEGRAHGQTDRRIDVDSSAEEWTKVRIVDYMDKQNAC